MSDDRTKTPKADRLYRAVTASRPQASIIPSRGTERVLKPTSANRTKSVIKYPKSGGALRQHVAEAHQPEKPLIKLRFSVRGLKASPKPAAKAPHPSPGGKLPEPAAQETKAPVRTALAQSVTSGMTTIETVLDLGNVVRQARRRQDLSQGELAASAGTGRRFISELEAGKPTLEFERLLKVCAVLGITILAVKT